MHVPISIPPGVLKVYTPSELTTNLPSEAGRKVFAENFQIGEEDGPTCSSLCLDVLSEYIKQHIDRIPDIDNFDCKERNFLIENLPLDLPLKVAIDFVPDDYFWKRYTQKRWPDVMSDKNRDGMWKAFHLQRYITEYIESQMPEYYDIEDAEEKCQLVADYIYDLDIKQLLPSQPVKGPEDDPEAPMTYPEDHFNVGIVLPHLPYLQTLRIKYGAAKLGDQFAWHKLKVSIDDCRRLGEGIVQLRGLRRLSFHRSCIGDDQLQPLLQALITYEPLEELDISYCLVGDRGALMLGKVLSEHPSLRVLKLPGNKIGALGAQGLAYGIMQTNSSPLIFLDLRLNPIGDDGVLNLFSGLIRVKKPRFLRIAGISVHGEGRNRIGEALKFQRSILELDITANELGEEAGDWLVSSMEQNIMLMDIDCRGTEITEEQLKLVEEYIERNKACGAPSLTDVKLESELVIHRRYSFPVTDSEIRLQDEKDEAYGLGYNEYGEGSEEDDLEIVFIKEYDGANHEEEESGLLGDGFGRISKTP